MRNNQESIAQVVLKVNNRQGIALLISFFVIPLGALLCWGYEAAVLAFGITMLVYGKGD